MDHVGEELYITQNNSSRLPFVAKRDFFCVFVGEFMLCDDGSDTEDSFSGDEENEGAQRHPPPLPSGGGASHLIPLSSDGRISSSAPTPTTKETVSGGGGGQDEDETKREEDKKKDSKSKEKESGEVESPEDRGDPEMVPVYLQRLLPIFTEIYHSSLAPALRKESLRLTRKMCRYISSTCLQELCIETAPLDHAHPPFSAQISEVLAAVLESEDDHEAHLAVLHIMQDLLSKNRAAFDEQFVRLGLANKIAGLVAQHTEKEGEEEAAGEPSGEPPASSPPPSGDNDGGAAVKEGEAGGSNGGGEREREGEGGKNDEVDGAASSEVKVPKEDGKSDLDHPGEASPLEDASDIVVSVPYRWRDWCVVRSRDCLYVWNEYCVIELSNVSNGWFRFLVDNRLATMYSSGSTEGGPDSYGKG